MNIAIEVGKDFQDLIAKEVKFVAAETPICPLIKGEPGIGKSSIIKDMCEQNGWWFFELLCNQLGDRSDLTGCRSVKSVENVNGKDEEIWKQIFFPHQSVQNAITCAQQNPNDIVVLFLDEINRTSSDITSAILSFTTARTIGTYTFPDNIRFIVAGNDKGNIQALDSASVSRFAQFTLIPSAAAWMAHEPNLNPYIQRVLQANPSYIFCKESGIVTSTVQNDDGDDYNAEYEEFDDAAEGFQQITTPRTISGLNTFLNHCDIRELTYYVGQQYKDADTGEDASLLQCIIKGHVGDTPFADALCVCIAEDVSKGMLQQANTITPPSEPAFYKGIMKCSDRQTRNDMIAKLSDDDKSALILYATWDKTETNGKGNLNREIITVAAQNYNNNLLTGNCQQQFSNLKSHDQLNEDNYSALVNSGTSLGTMIGSFLGMD